MTKLKNSNCDKTERLKKCDKIYKIIMTKLKHSSCDKTQNSNFTKLKNSVTELKNSNCDKIQKFKF